MVNKEMLDEISAEIHNARQKYRRISSLHEAHSIIMEEFEEFWSAVKNKEELERIRKELIQVIVASIMTLEDVFKAD